MELLKKILITSFFIFIFSVIFTTSKDFSQDLGRHLKLGEIIVKTHKIPETNLVSYTNPNFPFINHHWLSEVIFYLISLIFGFNSLLILKTILIFSAIAVLIKLSVKKSGVIPAIISGIIFTPFLIERNDIRPEIFGYLFFSVILYLLLSESINKKLLYLLPVIMMLWINIHISFIFGVFLILLFLLKVILVIPAPACNAMRSIAGNDKDSKNNKNSGNKKNKMLFFLVLSLVLLVLNPHGISGIFYPLNIFKNYGYTIVENQNIFYLKGMIFNPFLNYFFLLIPIILIIIITSMNRFIEVLLLLVFFILTCFQWRHLPFFVLVAIPVTTEVIGYLPAMLRKAMQAGWLMVIGKKIQINEFLKIFSLLFLILLSILGSLFFVTNQYSKIFDSEKKFGLGYEYSGQQAIDFVLKNNLQGRVFNNFDIGGYLIYKLYPKYQVFIDNRPEAYPAEFIENIYKKMHYEKILQKKIFNKYNIQTIFFSHADQTQWGEIFMKDIFSDKDWNFVYLDSSIIVLTKANMKDIRNKRNYLKNLLDNENNYLNLLKFARIYKTIGELKLANSAILKSIDLNSNSCNIKKYLYSKYLSNQELFYYKAGELRKNAWYCF